MARRRTRRPLRRGRCDTKAIFPPLTGQPALGFTEVPLGPFQNTGPREGEGQSDEQSIVWGRDGGNYNALKYTTIIDQQQ